MISAFKQKSLSPSKVVSPLTQRSSLIKSFYLAAVRLDRFGFAMLRLGLVVVLCWIGGLKAANYEAEGIVPFVANSPLMSFFYHYPAPEYREQNPAGGLNIANHEWNVRNGTYVFSYGLGCVIVGLGLLIALHPLLPQIAAVGSFLVILMALTTLSFPRDNPGGLGFRPGHYRPRISLSCTSRASRNQRFHHAWRGDSYNG